MVAEGKYFLEVLGALLSYLGAVLPTFAWVTIIFAVLDIGNTKFRLLEKITSESNDQFDPRKLPALRRSSDSPDAKPIPRPMTLFELFFSVAFLLWWIRVTPIRRLALFMTLGPAGLADKVPFQLGPVWHALFVPVVLLSLAAIGQQIVTLIYPHWVKFYCAARLIPNASSVVLLYVLIRAGDLLVLVPGVQDPSNLAEPLRIVNLVFHYSLVLAAAITIFECLKMVRKLIRVRYNPAAAPAL